MILALMSEAIGLNSAESVAAEAERYAARLTGAAEALKAEGFEINDDVLSVATLKGCIQKQRTHGTASELPLVRNGGDGVRVVIDRQGMYTVLTGAFADQENDLAQKAKSILKRRGLLH